MDSARPQPERLVSIVVPVFNGARFLAEALDSIVAQTWPQLEIIVMDDASADDSAGIAERFVARPASRVQVHRQATNRGQFRNVEDGIARATGDYIAVFHADDRYDPTLVAQEVAYLDQHPEVGTVFAMHRLMDGAGREYGVLRLPDALVGAGPMDVGRVLNGILEHKNVFLPTPSAMVRRELYACVGHFRTEFGSAADLDMWLRLARLAPLALIERHLFSYRHTSSSVAQSYQRLRQEPDVFFALMERHIAECAEVAIDPAARRAFEGHRAVDTIRVTVNSYIMGDQPTMRARWRTILPLALVRGHRIDRPRHLVLWGLLGILALLPRIPLAARALHWRYYDRLPWWNTTA